MSLRVSVPDAAIQRLSRLLLARVGLRPAKEGEAGLRLAIAARMEALGERDALAFVERLESGAAQELRALLPLVTVGKTEFFRDSNQFKALRAQVFPQMLARARREMRPLRVWSAGCATGEEPYSLAMLAADLKVEPEGLELLATDVNPEAVDRARQGRFATRRLATVPAEMIERFFVREGEEYQANEGLRSYIRFATHNLADVAFPVPKSGGLWDVVLCRNVIIYFDGPTTAKVIGRFFDRLVEGGYLCLGYSESLYRISSDFELTEVEGSFLYRRPVAPKMRAVKPRVDQAIERLREAVAARKARGAEEPAPRPPAPNAPTPLPGTLPRVPAEGPRPVAAPVTVPTPLPGTLPRVSEARPAANAPQLALALPEGPEVDPIKAAAALLEQGEFEAALKLLRQSLETSPGNLALLVTLGNVLTVMSRPLEAREAYELALAAEPLCAEPHLFLGIACFEAGDPALAEEAAQELGRAIFLDPNLALAHYFLGRLAERRGDLAEARRAYRNAVSTGREARGWAAPLLGHFPDMPSDPAVLARAAQYALAAIEEVAV